jgi:uncharacterized protein YjiS (DUF1127 family)
MAHAQTIWHAPCRPRPSVRRLFEGWRATVAEWRRRARSRRELAMLCNRCLRDFGATRYNVDREVRKPFWRE